MIPAPFLIKNSSSSFWGKGCFLKSSSGLRLFLFLFVFSGKAHVTDDDLDNNDNDAE